MRILPFAAATLLATAAFFAVTGPDALADRDVDRATVSLVKGRDLLYEGPKDESTAARLRRLDRSIGFLRRARTLAAGDVGAAVRAQATIDLVCALDDQAEIYLYRQSLPLARKRVLEARALDPSDPRTQRLVHAIVMADSSSGYSSGGVGGQRIRDRRDAAARTFSGPSQNLRDGLRDPRR